MNLLVSIYKEIKKRLIELRDFKRSRVENYESPSTIAGASLLITLISNNSLIYAKIALFILAFYLFALYLILKTPKKRTPFK